MHLVHSSVAVALSHISLHILQSSLRLRPLDDAHILVHQLGEVADELRPQAPVLQAADVLYESRMELDDRRLAWHARRGRSDTRALRVRPVNTHSVCEADEEVVEIDLRARGAGEDQLATHGRPWEVVDPDCVRIIASFGDGAVPWEAAVEARLAGTDKPAGDEVHPVEDSKAFRVAVDVWEFRQDVEQQRC